MSVTLKDRAYCTTTGTGTGALDLVAEVGHVAPATSDELHYCIFDDAGNWEIGSAATWPNLRRDLLTAPFSSSNANRLVNWGAGTKRVVFGMSASNAVICGRDSSNTTWVNPKATAGGIAAGDGAVANTGIALGEHANTVSGVAVGRQTYTTDGVVAGDGSFCDNGVAIGLQAFAGYATHAVALGRGTVCGSVAGVLTDAVAVGNAAKVFGERGIAIGKGAGVSANVTDSVAIGRVVVGKTQTMEYSPHPTPTVSGDVQGIDSTYITTLSTVAGAGSVSVYLPTRWHVLFNIDVIGLSADSNYNVVGVNMVGLKNAAGLVGTPVTTVRGRSAAYAAGVTASISAPTGDLRVTVAASALIPMKWVIVARMSAIEQAV